MAINWHQVGEDFEQKYNGCFCRYLSPRSNKKEIFTITSVDIHEKKPPDLSLYNEAHGEIFLSYTGESDLDFTFPEIGNFQHKDKALRFEKAYQRQWRKGICSNTARIVFPYSGLYPAWNYHLTDEILGQAFAPFTPVKISDATKELDSSEKFSVALSPTLSIGLSDKQGTYWIWFEDEAIGTVDDNKVVIHNPLYIQEVTDFVRDIRDNVQIARP